jgi:NAD(P)-dependent dehydrogenase (short-subunit alcohol dehydrogenase family)
MAPATILRSRTVYGGRVLQGKVVLITGGARGVGAATAALLVTRGAKVVLVDLDAEPLRELVARLGPEQATSILGDVTELRDMQAAVAHGVERFGGIDVVVANAGIASYGSVGVVDPAVFRRVIDINITGVFHTVRAALPQIEQRKGYVLVVSSEAAYAPAPGLASYNASKAGAEHFANALRLELGYKGGWQRAHVVDRHADGAGRQARPGGLSRDARLTSRPAGRDDLGGRVR